MGAAGNCVGIAAGCFCGHYVFSRLRRQTPAGEFCVEGIVIDWEEEPMGGITVTLETALGDTVRQAVAKPTKTKKVSSTSTPLIVLPTVGGRTRHLHGYRHIAGSGLERRFAGDKSGCRS